MYWCICFIPIILSINEYIHLSFCTFDYSLICILLYCCLSSDELADTSRLSESVKKFVTDTVTLSLVTPGCLLDVDDLNRPPPPGEGREILKSGRGARSVRTSVMGATISGNLAGGHSRLSNEDSDTYVMCYQYITMSFVILSNLRWLFHKTESLSLAFAFFDLSLSFL